MFEKVVKKRSLRTFSLKRRYRGQVDMESETIRAAMENPLNTPHLSDVHLCATVSTERAFVSGLSYLPITLTWVGCNTLSSSGCSFSANKGRWESKVEVDRVLSSLTPDGGINTKPGLCLNTRRMWLGLEKKTCFGLKQPLKPEDKLFVVLQKL